MERERAHDIEISERAAIVEVAQGYLARRLVTAKEINTFAETVRKRRQRSRSVRESIQTHGNMLLGPDQEEVVVGYLQGVARRGDDATKQMIIDIVNIIWDVTPSRDWYYEIYP